MTEHGTTARNASAASGWDAINAEAFECADARWLRLSAPFDCDSIPCDACCGERGFDCGGIHIECYRCNDVGSLRTRACDYLTDAEVLSLSSAQRDELEKWFRAYLRQIAPGPQSACGLAQKWFRAIADREPQWGFNGVRDSLAVRTEAALREFAAGRH